MDLDVLQDTIHDWRKRNFGEHILPYEQLLGVVEEVGELAHAHLKNQQGIRGYNREKFESEAQDAVGDILIFLMGYCSLYGWSMADILQVTAANVMARDWIEDPVSGGE